VISNRYRRMAAGLAAMFAALALCATAHAEAIPLGGAQGTEYFHAGVLVRPASFDVNEFFSTVAGTVTVSVQRIEWGDLFSQLQTTVALMGRPDLTFANNALTVFDVTAGERFATSIYAQVTGLVGYGAYRLDVLFIPKTTQVPLPPAAWLLLSGLGMWVLVARRRRGAAEKALI
jgi:hypothetical protein